MTSPDDSGRREQTDRSLQTERDKADDRDSADHSTVDDNADEVVRVAREHADEVEQTAHDAVADQAGAAGARTRARAVLVAERDRADAQLEGERADRRRGRAASLEAERSSTDQDLTGERTGADSTMVDLREANAQMVGATLRAHDAALEAEAARGRAEANERELRAVAEFRERFIGILGHDLRNPVNAISLSAARLIARGKLDKHDAAAAARILRSSDRIGRMIMQLLDLTRARLGGGMPIDREPTDLGGVGEQVVEEFDGDVRLEVQGDVTGCWDGDRLAEVLSNLVGNAVSHAAPGTAVIVKVYAAAADVVVVEVVNQGPAIPADVLPHIFEPFRQAERVRSTAGNLGLGLYIAHEIVRVHGGTLEARSTGGVTTFTMRLPRNVTPA